jgi:uncharacterized protein YndB with AHSA1/START domain
MRFRNTISINRPPATVFAYLADLENLPRWNYAIGETRKVTSGPVGVGSQYRQTRTIPVHTEESLEVVEFEPGRGITILGTLNSLPARIGYTLRPEAAGTTVINTVELKPPGLVGLLAPIAVPKIKSAVAANLDVLRQILEEA